MAKQTVAIEVFRHAESKSGLNIGLVRLFMLFVPFFVLTYHCFLLVFRKMPSFQQNQGCKISRI